MTWRFLAGNHHLVLHREEREVSDGETLHQRDLNCSAHRVRIGWIDGERANARAEGCAACGARAVREECPGSTVSGRTPAQKESRMQTLLQIVLAFLAAALLLIVLVVVLAIRLIRMLAGAEEEVAEHPARETESVRRAERK